MINIDTRLLTSDISDGELRLLMTIASFINENMKAWQSNAKILERTGWSLGKLQLTKKALEEKGLLKIESRHRDNAQTSNVYTLNCPLIGVYVQANKIKLYFFSILNHDLRGPLASLIHFLHLQKNDPEILDPKTKERLEKTTIESAEHLLESMEDLLLWSKGQMENFKPYPKKLNLKMLFDVQLF